MRLIHFEMHFAPYATLHPHMHFLIISFHNALLRHLATHSQSNKASPHIFHSFEQMSWALHGYGRLSFTKTSQRECGKNAKHEWKYKKSLTVPVISVIKIIMGRKTRDSFFLSPLFIREQKLQPVLLLFLYWASHLNWPFQSPEKWNTLEPF